MSRFDAVCFDLDGTLCVSDQDPAELLDVAFERTGVDPFFAARDVAAVDPGTLPTADTDVEFHEYLFDAAAERAGAGASAATVTALARAYVETLDPTEVSSQDGARAVLEYASERYDLALVTNGGEATQTAKLDALGITDHFDVEVYCDPDAGVVPKPDPTPFRLALDELGVQADRALKVGDSHGADVVGAYNVGMRSVWVPRTEHPTVNRPTEPDPAPIHRLDSMTDLSTVI